MAGWRGGEQSRRKGQDFRCACRCATLKGVPLYQFPWSLRSPRQFARAILPAFDVPVLHESGGPRLDTVTIWDKGYIFLNIPERLIDRLESGASVIVLSGTVIREPDESNEGKIEQIDAVIIEDVE